MLILGPPKRLMSIVAKETGEIWKCTYFSLEEAYYKFLCAAEL